MKSPLKGNKRKSVVFWSVMIILPLFVGLILYLIFKPSAFISKFIFDLFGLQPFSIQASNKRGLLFVRFYLCDLLWAFSLTAISQLILGYSKTKLIVSLLISILVGTAIELLQKYMIIPGTFDIPDIVTESVGAILSLIIIIVYTRRKRDEKQHY